MNARKPVIVTAACFAALLTVSCKINKDANCLNPKASCYKKDTEAPSIISTVPANATRQATLNTVEFSFSEPMKNADAVSVYSNITQPLGGTLQPVSVTKVNEQTFRVSFSGNVVFGNVFFNFQSLTDLSGNSLLPSTYTFQTGPIGAVPDTVTSTGGYTETNIFWKNDTPDAMTYAVKKNGTDCSTASAVTGVNVTGTVMPGGDVVTNLGFAQITAGATDTIRVCLTPVTTGTATALNVNVSRDDSPPTLSAPITARVKIPYAISLNCTDNVDRIIYTIDGSAPFFTVTPTGSSIGATASANSYAFSIANGYSLTTRGAVPFKYLCIDKAGHTNTGGVLTSNLQSKFVWDESNWAPVSPNDHWD